MEELKPSHLSPGLEGFTSLLHKLSKTHVEPTVFKQLMEKVCCQLIRLHFLLTWRAVSLLASKQAPRLPWKRAQKRLEIQTFYPHTESILQVCPVPFLPLRRLPPAQSSGQRGCDQVLLWASSPLFPGLVQATSQRTRGGAVPGAANRWLHPSAWHGAAERAGARRSGAGSVRGAERHSRHLLFMSRPEAPKGPIFT